MRTADYKYRKGEIQATLGPRRSHAGSSTENANKIIEHPVEKVPSARAETSRDEVEDPVLLTGWSEKFHFPPDQTSRAHQM